jgi:hypothetical protein
MPEMTRQIFVQLNRSLLEKSRESGVLKHNLEQGLANEEAVRRLLRAFLPSKYGVAKGKIINEWGDISRHCDIIIYDHSNCPTLFVDDNDNQVIPAEGVFEIVEVKTTLNATTLREAFEELITVYRVSGERAEVRSINNKVDYRPPFLSVLALRGPRLETVARTYEKLSREYLVEHSTATYSSRSPGRAHMKDVSTLAVSRYDAELFCSP